MPFVKSAAYKSKYTIKPILSQNKVHYPAITKTGSKLSLDTMAYLGKTSTFFGQSAAYKLKYTLIPPLCFKTKNHWPKHLINDKGDCRTALATPGLLTITSGLLLAGQHFLSDLLFEKNQEPRYSPKY